MKRLQKIAACLLLAGLAMPAMGEPLRIFAAASLREAISEVAQDYEAATGEQIVTVFLASSAIARQVQQGAPADIALLADEEWALWLLDKAVVGRLAPFAGNRLVLIGQERLDDIASLPQVLDGGPISMAHVDAVPAGRYGKAAFEALGIWDALSGQVVQADNVRAALRFVEQGEVAFGVGYASDLVALPALALAHEFDVQSYGPIRYFGAAMTEKGDGFLTYLTGAAAQSSLAEWGFEPLGAQR